MIYDCILPKARPSHNLDLLVLQELKVSGGQNEDWKIVFVHCICFLADYLCGSVLVCLWKCEVELLALIPGTSFLF